MGQRGIKIGVAVLIIGTSQLLSSQLRAATIDCSDVEGIKSICGLVEPEDIVRAPNGRDLIFGQMADPGGLYLLDTSDDSVHSLFNDHTLAVAAEASWGDSACVAPPDSLHAHGLSLSRRNDGRWQLLVVNHHQRESVEFLEYLPPVNTQYPTLVWRGCAVAPEQASINDVAGLPDGGFLVTHMADKDSTTWSLFWAMLGIDSGFVYRWNAAHGFSEMPGTSAEFPNGISISPDGKSFFLNVYFGSQVRKHDLVSGELLGTAEVEKPDNSSWTPQGKLWVASHRASIGDLLKSMDDRDGTPGELRFAVIEIDPQSMEQRLILEREGPPMGAGTVAVKQGSHVYIGSFLGDRIIKVPLPEEG